MAADASSPSWSDGIYDLLKQARVKQVCHVPDAGHARLMLSVRGLCLAYGRERVVRDTGLKPSQVNAKGGKWK